MAGTTLRGMRVAVAGMGRSGRAIAHALARRGAEALVYDEGLADTPERLAAVEALQGMGAEVATGWHGRLAGEDFDLLVASPGFRRRHPAIRDALAAGREVISEVEFAYRIASAPIVAITGTNGKSTTTVLAWLLLQAAGKEAILCGNIAGSGYAESTLTEAADTAGENAVLVAEVSSFQLEWVARFAPSVAAITNVHPDHMDRHPSFEDYFCTKLRVFGGMQPGALAVANESEPTLPFERIESALPEGVGLRTFALTPPEGASGPSTYRDGSDIVLAGKRAFLFDLPLFGDHQVANALMAWEVALAAGASGELWQPMVGALAGFEGLTHRMQRLGERGGVLVVNNSMCTNPAAVVASSRSLPRRQHLLLGGNTKNLDFAPVREHLEREGHVAYVFGPETELAEQLPQAVRAASLDDAFALAASSAQRGEAILLAPGCMSTAPFQDFRERGQAFIGMAKRWLSES